MSAETPGGVCGCSSITGDSDGKSPNCSCLGSGLNIPSPLVEGGVAGVTRPLFLTTGLKGVYCASEHGFAVFLVSCTGRFAGNS